jgi:6-phosphogluconolactonase (cycloisomerase 2 family)
VVTNAAGTASAQGTALPAIVALASQPAVSAPAYVSSGKGGYTASVPAQTGCTYAWSITNGNLTSGATAATATFSAGGLGQVGLSCTVTNAGGTAAPAGTAQSAIVPLPAISLLSAGPSDVASGAASTLSYTFSNGTGVLMPGSLPVTSGSSSVVHPLSTTAYTLTVTNLAGDSVSDTAIVTVGAPPSIDDFKALPGLISAGQGTLLTFQFTGTGVITPGNLAVSSGSQVAVFPATDTTYTLTVTNAFGATTTATAQVTVKAFTARFVYVANAGGGLSGFALNGATGALAELSGSPFEDGDPYLHATSDPQGRFLFAVKGDGLGHHQDALAVFRIDPVTGGLSHLADHATGSNPWASAVDPSGRFVYVRCDGSLSAFSLNGTTGALTPLAAPSAATSGGTGDVLVHPSGRHLFTVGRTSDRLQVFDLDPATGALGLNGSTGLPIGTGPLSLALSHSGEYLFTKSEGAPGGSPQGCLVYGYHVEAQTGGLTPLAPTDTGLMQADAFHGVSANPTQAVLYITLATTDNDYAAYALNLNDGSLLPLAATTYDLFGGTGSDSLVVSRNGAWGFMTNFQNNQIAVGAVDPATGVLTAPVFYPVGTFPVSVAVVGTLQ